MKVNREMLTEMLEHAKRAPDLTDEQFLKMLFRVHREPEDFFLAILSGWYTKAHPEQLYRIEDLLKSKAKKPS